MSCLDSDEDDAPPAGPAGAVGALTSSGGGWASDRSNRARENMALVTAAQAFEAAMCRAAAWVTDIPAADPDPQRPL